MYNSFLFLKPLYFKIQKKIEQTILIILTLLGTCTTFVGKKKWFNLNIKPLFHFISIDWARWFSKVFKTMVFSSLLIKCNTRLIIPLKRDFFFRIIWNIGHMVTLCQVTLDRRLNLNLPHFLSALENKKYINARWSSFWSRSHRL
jgi:hypothetical protein